MSLHYRIELYDHTVTARAYRGEKRLSVYVPLDTSKPKPDWMEQELWEEAVRMQGVSDEEIF